MWVCTYVCCVLTQTDELWRIFQAYIYASFVIFHALVINDQGSPGSPTCPTFCIFYGWGGRPTLSVTKEIEKYLPSNAYVDWTYFEKIITLYKKIHRWRKVQVFTCIFSQNIETLNELKILKLAYFNAWG